MINEIKDAIVKNGPTYSKPAANKTASLFDIFPINIDAAIYFAEIKIEDIKQKIAPIPLLFIMKHVLIIYVFILLGF